MSSAIEKHILEVTGLKLQGNDRQKQLEQIAHAINSLDDEGWRKLNSRSQKWFNAASAAIDKEGEIADFPDLAAKKPAAAPEAAEDEASEPVEQKERKMATKPKKKVAANGEARAKKKVAAKTTAHKKAKAASSGEGAPVLIRRMVIKDPKITAKELNEKLEAKGVKVSKLTVSSIRSSTMAMLKMLDDEGHLKNLKLA